MEPESSLSSSQEPSTGPYPEPDQSSQYHPFLFLCGALSLTRGRACRLQLLLALTSAVILRSESRGICDYILLSQIQDSLFVVSYDSQDYDGGIRPRLHTVNSSVLLNTQKTQLLLLRRRVY
jgi:hypothetical protein